MLFVGTLEPRKNLERLVAALAMDSTLPPLVVAGLDGWGEMGNVKGTAVHFVGHVDDWNLPALYDQASALCYPSLWEGFGLPILEAMSQGTPVVTSSGTSTEEVAGSAAVLVDRDRRRLVVVMRAAIVPPVARAFEPELGGQVVEVDPGLQFVDRGHTGLPLLN